MNQKKERVVVLGASPNPERYSYKAVCMLLEHGHEVVPVHPVADKIEGLPVVAKQISTVSLPQEMSKTLAIAKRLSPPLQAALPP